MARETPIEAVRADRTESAPPARRVVHPRAALNAWRISVMLVDDDEADASLVVDILKRHRNVGSTEVFHRAGDALTELVSGRRRPDLILLDINMPLVDGFKFMEVLNAIPDARRTPVVMLTTSRFARDVDRARQSTACGYIVKPDSYADLKKRLDATITQAISGKWS
jgi:CheY-like chemotaxis protein